MIGDPAELETSGADETKIDWNGHTFVVPARMEDADSDVIDALDDGKVSHAIRGLLGDEQWAELKAMKPKAGAYGEIANLWAEAIGLDTSGKS